ncbi:hypothetical protein FRB97_005686 [Tulasnella sp. 331]|nr:hypothetical protein FRB97_005686 [Tulasnella sp. 331]
MDPTTSDAEWVKNGLGNIETQLNLYTAALHAYDGTKDPTLATLATDYTSLTDRSSLTRMNPEAVILRDSLDTLANRSYDAIQSLSSCKEALPFLLRLFEVTCLARSLLDLLLYDPLSADRVNESFWKDAIGRVDRAIIITGADQNMDLAQEFIKRIQHHHLPLKPPTSHRETIHVFLCGSNVPHPPAATTSVLRLQSPSMNTYRQHWHTPFVIPSYATDWPAMKDHPWSSPSYLNQVAGRGRLVPIEVGADYRRDDWTQRLMDWETFLQALDGREDETDEPGSGPSSLYLAQHSLFNQFPAMRADIEVPPYVYAVPPAPSDYPDYEPPGNDEQLVMNAWIGPRGTISPAHTDPYYNCYVQVVGRKTVWLAPPYVTPWMYPHDLSLSNTSRVDVFSTSNLPRSDNAVPLFYTHVVPSLAQRVTLQPGDMLLFPPGWWHAMRSEDVSISVSMWF